jgi:hypothetical protein
MARQDNVKIITTALLVVLLLSSFIFGFVYRNEIYQKIQSISKSEGLENKERLIGTEPAWTPPKSDKLEPADLDTQPLNEVPKETKRTELADITPLDEMEDTFQKPPSKSISVTQVNDTKKLTEKESQKQIDSQKQTNTQNANQLKKQRSEMEAVSEVSSNQTAVKLTNVPKSNTIETKQSVTSGNSEATTKRKISKSKKQNRQRSPKKAIAKLDKKENSETPKPRVTSNSGNRSSLEARIQAIETKIELQNQKNDSRFSDIERRIDKLEKSLGSK